MKPGIPWSVKGIEQQAREAAKEAARQSGMTIGEWLNTMILDSADGADDLERRYRRQPYRQKLLTGTGSGAGTGEGEEVTLQLEQIADQLHDMARHDSDTALPRHAGAGEEAVLRAIIERLDAHEHHTTTAIGSMQERLEEVSQQLRGARGDTAPQGDDLPGYRALEAALRNIIEHIEISEKRTCETIRSLQERLSERADAALPNDLDEVRQTEQRLRGLVEEAMQAAGKLDPDATAAQLRLEMEQLAATVSQGSSHALSDLGSRIEQLEIELNRQSSERDRASQRELAALSERIAGTEKRLDHLATIEQSVAKLARNLGEDGSEGRRTGGASPELRALEEGLEAVRASAEYSDRRTQETLQAVHDTLEHIVAKLADLEAGESAVTDEALEEALEEAVGLEHAEVPADVLGEAEPAADDVPPADAEAGSAADAEEAEEAETGAARVMEFEGDGFTFPEAPAANTGTWEAPEEARSEVASDSEPHAYSEPAEPAVREDYIAEARRAAQASSRNSGFNRFSKRLSGSGSRAVEPVRGKVQKRGFVSSLMARLRGGKARPGEAAPPRGRKSSRKSLILCGLGLLAAASAYGLQYHRDLIPDIELLGSALIPAQASPQVLAGDEPN